MTERQDISLRDIIEILRRRRLVVLGSIAAALVIGVCYAVLTKPLYTATVTLRVLTDESGGALGGLANQLGGAAALVGINLPSGSNEQGEYLAILESRELAEHFIEEYALMQHLFPDSWDGERSAWIEGKPGWLGRLRLAVSRSLARVSGDEGWSTPPGVPSAYDAYQKLDRMKRLSEPTETGIIELSIEFNDPKLAAEWANAYVAMANKEIRENAISEATRALVYLEEEIGKTKVVELRETIYGLVRAQLEKIMLANARPQYAFKIIDTAIVPMERSHPDRGAIVVLSLLLGAFLGVLGALTREAWLNLSVLPDDGG